MRVNRWLMLAAVVSLGACDKLNIHFGSRSPTRRVKVGKSVTGTLAATDRRLRNRGPYQVWTLHGKKGERVVIDLTSSSFDSYLVARSADGFAIGSDDDGGGNLNARLRTIFPRSADYTIVVGSVGSEAHGDYTLTVSEWVMPDAPRAGAVQNLDVGQTKDGLLEPGDEITADGPYQDRWTFEVPAGARRRIEMRSTDLDAYLILLGPNDSVMSTNDDADRRDAAIGFRAPAQGRYTALATTYGDQPRMGAYRIALTEPTGSATEPGTVTPIGAGQSRDGVLESGDSVAPTGAYRDVYLFRADGNGVVTIDLTSSALDPLLVFQDSLGNEMGRDDDGGEGLNSQLVMAVQRGALYRIAATTFSSGSRDGAYHLALSPLLAGAAPGSGIGAPVNAAPGLKRIR